MRITPPAERALRKGHPWIFDQSVTDISHAGAPGDLAVIFDDKRRFQGIGLYDPVSPIRVRILQAREPATINTNWFLEKLDGVSKMRAWLESTGTTGYRLVHGENDGLPGLVLDRYADTLVYQTLHPRMDTSP